MSALVGLWLVSGSSWADMMLYYQSLHLPAAIIFTEKLLLAFPFTYHTCNGVRHLVRSSGIIVMCYNNGLSSAGMLVKALTSRLSIAVATLCC